MIIEKLKNVYVPCGGAILKGNKRTILRRNIMDKWISFNLEKPKKNGYYFCYHMTSKCGKVEVWEMEILYWEDNLWLYSPRTFKTSDSVSHWMELPEPPQNDFKE